MTHYTSLAGVELLDGQGGADPLALEARERSTGTIGLNRSATEDGGTSHRSVATSRWSDWIEPANSLMTAQSGYQVSRYWGRYRLVLVTNTRDFVLVGKDLVGPNINAVNLRSLASARGRMGDRDRQQLEPR